MLVVVTDIEGDHVEGAVVRVRLEALVKHVVLGDEVAGNGVQAHGHQGPAQHVEQHFAACNKEKKCKSNNPTYNSHLCLNF